VTRELTPPAAPARPLPALGPENEAFWTGGREGRLMICRCRACGAYAHPPRPRCPQCHGAQMAPAPVSGRGRVAAFTVNRQAWVPGLATPYVFAAVELEEQAELYVLSNIVGCPPEAVRTGLPVEVLFEPHEEVFVPLFRPAQEGAP